MFEKPGIQRGVPMAIVGFIIGIAIVQLVRTLQQMDPLWDPGVAFVVVPFFIVGFFMWGMGAFDPRMSEHPHGPEDVEETAMVMADEGDHPHAESESGPFALLMGQFWRVAFATILMVVILFAVATAPTGLFLRTVNEDTGNVAAIDAAQSFLLPLGVDTVEASQLSVFLGFIIFTLVSLLVVAGAIGFVFFAFNGEAKRAAETETTPQERRPPAPVRFIGRTLSNAARGLRRGLPHFFGYRN